MKKILLATTMLAGTAGFAAAEITMSGSARMGLVYTGGTAGTAAVAPVQGVHTAATIAALGQNGIGINPGDAVTAQDMSTLQANAAQAAADLAIYSDPTEQTSVNAQALATATSNLAAAVAAQDAAAIATAQTALDAAQTTFNAGQEVTDAAAAAAAVAAASGTAGVDAVAGAASTTRMEYRTRISITGAGETDSGLSYSATIRLQDSSTAASTQAIGVTVSGAFGSLTFGSESSAAEYAVGDLAGVGYVGQGGSDTTFLVGAFALYKYSAGDFTAYVSSGQIDSDDVSIGGSFAAGDLTVGVGYEDNGDVTHTAASVSYAMGDTKIKAIYGTSGDLDLTQSGISVAQTMGATTLTAYYRTEEVGAVQTDDNFGIGVAHDLGGGGALKAGFESINDQSHADLGLTFKF